MSTLTVEMKVPIQCDPVIDAPALTFAHWLPVGKERGILVSQDGIDLVLWFDLGATSGLKQEDIAHQQNVFARHVRVDASVARVTARTAAYIRTKDFSRQPTPDEVDVQ